MAIGVVMVPIWCHYRVMSPHGNPRDKAFKMVLANDEHEQLMFLAGKAEVSAATFLRQFIRRAYAETLERLAEQYRNTIRSLGLKNVEFIRINPNQLNFLFKRGPNKYDTVEPNDVDDYIAKIAKKRNK